MLVPDFGPTMNVIAYSPFQDGASAEAVGGSNTAIASDAAHKPARLHRRSGTIGFSFGSATTLELERAVTILDIYPIYTFMPTNLSDGRTRSTSVWQAGPRACLPMIWGVGGDDRAYDACGSDFG